MGYHYLGGGKTYTSFKEIDDAQSCQDKCASDNKCNWFNWGTNVDPKICYLLTEKGLNKNIDGIDAGVTGPKICDGWCSTTQHSVIISFIECYFLFSLK